MAVVALNQVSDLAGGYRFGWSLGGGTALMLQMDHRTSHDIDVFVDDHQIFGFLNPELSDLNFGLQPSEVTSDGSKFIKFTFGEMGEIDFIVSGHLTDHPFVDRVIEGVPTRLETIAEVIAKKVYYRGAETQARDIFDIAAAAARGHRAQIVEALREFPDQVMQTLERIRDLNPLYVAANIEQLMISPGYRELVPVSYTTVAELLQEAMKPSVSSTQEPTTEAEDGREHARRLALINALTAHITNNGLTLPSDDFADLLARYADESQLQQMVKDVHEMGDVREFAKSHGVSLPGYDT